MNDHVFTAIGGLVGGLLAKGVGVVRGVADGVLDADSFEICSSFGCNTYRLELVSAVDNGDGTVTVTWTKERLEDDANALGEVVTEVAVAGSVIGTQTSSNGWASFEVTETTTGAGAAGDAVTVTATTTAFGGGTATVSGTVASPSG